MMAATEPRHWPTKEHRDLFETVASLRTKDETQRFLRDLCTRAELDAKLRQYKDGAAFVRRVVDRVGMEGFNRVWTGPNTLPTKNEIANPDAWVARLHG